MSMGFRVCYAWAGRSPLKMVLALLGRWADVRRERPLLLRGTWFSTIVVRVVVVVDELVVAITIAPAPRLVVTLLWYWIGGREEPLSLGWLVVTDAFDGGHRCRIIRLLLQSVIPIIGFVLPLLQLLLLPLPLSNGINIECRADQLVLVFVYHASNSMTTILLTKLVLC
jgi:hypothetical protein